MDFSHRHPASLDQRHVTWQSRRREARVKPGVAAALLACLALAGCPEQGDDCAGWQSRAGGLDRVALAVQGRGPDDVWVVGGGLGLGGALAAHWDGAGWTRRDPDLDDTLWWVWTAPDDTVWMVGERGAVVRMRGADVQVDRIATDATIYGVWGAASDDVWLVGGVAGGGPDGEDDLIRRWDGAAFVTPAGVPARGATLFKVWGSTTSDVWLSGEAGTMLRWNGLGFEDRSAELATLAPALTVHGCSATEAYAVAGQRLYGWDGARWQARTDVSLGSVASGVACGAAGVVVVGNAGLKLRWDRATGAWSDDRAAAPTATDLHGAWVDDAGRTWAVGGNFNQPGAARRTGVVGVRGCPAVGSW